MSKILFLVEPAEGHFNPCIVIIKALLKRDHEVACITGSQFKARVEKEGAIFFPLPEQWDPGELDIYDFFPELKNKKGLAQIKQYLKHIVYDQVPDMLERLNQVLDNFHADVIVCDSFMAAGHWLTELGGAPSVRLSVFPFSLPEKNIAPFGLGLLPGDTFLTKLRNNLLNLLFEKILFKDVQSHINLVREKVGLTHFDKYFFTKAVEIPNLVLQTTSVLFEYPRKNIPSHVQFVGPLLNVPDEDYVMPDWWAETFDKKLPIILINQGTVAKNLDNLINPAIEALKDLPVTVLIVPVEKDELTDLPENMHAKPFIPFGNVLPHIDIMISNGGLGGVQNALAHAVSLIIAGATEDKMEVAARVEYSGAGINLRTQTPSAADIKNAVNRLLHNPSFKQKATILQADYAKYNAVTSSVNAIEQLIEDQKYKKI